jgi:valyl-tRNA synthetase
MVDPKFGTGVVKITPAHSFDDWEAAQRHDLPAKRVINHDGTMNHEAGRFAGMTIMEARKAVVEALKEKGLLVKVDENYRNRIGHCYKCETVIEPMLMEQWFIDMQPLAQPAIKALKDGRINFYPESKKTQLITYLENLKDWNISRQIAWGIPIPAFQNVDDSDDWIYDERVTEEIIEIDGKTYHRDPDVFDTWFSSSSWPYATLDYPDNDDYQQFYPLSLMETGFDILYPWVSRMLMLGLYVTGDVPFKNVYLHGLILDEHGQKMSKSKGNVINPMDIIDQHGSDAVRMGLLTGQTPGNNQPFGTPKVIGARNFCNKLWNIGRYVAETTDGTPDTANAAPESDADHWVLARLQETADTIAGYLDDYRFSEAYETLYHFVWDDFADWYIEASKSARNGDLLALTLEGVLKIAHPFAPFLTETIWQALAWQPDTVLASCEWPTIPAADKKRAKAFEEVKVVVGETRAIMKAAGVTKTNLTFGEAPVIEANIDLIKRLARLESVAYGQQEGGIKLNQTKYDVRLDISDEVAKQYAAKLAEQEKAEAAAIKNLEGRLKNKSYVENAPAHVVDQTREQLANAQARLASIKEEAARLT